MSNKDRSLLTGRLRSFVYAGRGIVQVFRNEPNAKIHLLAACVVITLGLVLNVSKSDFALLAFAITMVFVTETINTAIERLTDLASPEHHPLAAQAKDIAAGAVLLASIGAVFIGVIVFLPT
jgi:diacylglycerol kinase (ATP)